MPEYTYAGYTNDAGELIFTIEIDPEWPINQVDAYTQGQWLTVLNQCGTYKNLAPAPYGACLRFDDDFFVVPEYTYGVLIATIACFASFATYKKNQN